MAKLITSTQLASASARNVLPSRNAYNRMVEASQLVNDNRPDAIGPVGEDLPWSTWIEIEYEYSSGRPALDAGQVLGIQAPFFPVGGVVDRQQADDMYSDLTLIGVPPDSGHKGNLAVLYNPLNPGEIGKAFVSGCCMAKVKMASLTDERCDVDPGEYNMVSGSDGAWKILWHPATLGDQVVDAVVIYSPSGAEAAAPTIGLFEGSASAGSAPWKATLNQEVINHGAGLELINDEVHVTRSGYWYIAYNWEVGFTSIGRQPGKLYSNNFDSFLTIAGNPGSTVNSGAWQRGVLLEATPNEAIDPQLIATGIDGLQGMSASLIADLASDYVGVTMGEVIPFSGIDMTLLMFWLGDSA